MRFIAEAALPTRFGNFKVMAFKDRKKEHVVLVKGTLKEPVNVRVHSKCLTGDTLSSMRCDCREQLEASLKYINKRGGLIIYLDQEGRGIGFANKIKAYALQDKGYDTVEANRMLGFEEDHRDFRIAAAILHYLGIETIKLITNNPRKLKELEDSGIEVERIPLIITPNKHNRKYLETKKKKMGHEI